MLEDPDDEYEYPYCDCSFCQDWDDYDDEEI